MYIIHFFLFIGITFFVLTFSLVSFRGSMMSLQSAMSGRSEASSSLSR